MKKILFEQIGNIIMLALLISAMIQSILTSTLTDDGIYLSFGYLWFAFLAYMIVFGLLRFCFSKLKHNGGYDMMKGEFSAEDEREKAIAKKAARRSYESMMILAIINCAVLFALALLCQDFMLFKVVALSLVGSSIILSFLVYTCVWVYHDSKA